MGTQLMEGMMAKSGEGRARENRGSKMEGGSVDQVPLCRLSATTYPGEIPNTFRAPMCF